MTGFGVREEVLDGSKVLEGFRWEQKGDSENVKVFGDLNTSLIFFIHSFLIMMTCE